ncbi:DUF317 domain-containing protein [Streptomyces sp. NBC_00133]|uniref:DUF317 domain-containing protein n=1 Tax=Streptomyces sp. NBC_00133 TaxID=2903624 RepID=UPI0032485FA1
MDAPNHHHAELDRERTWSDDTTVASHQSLALRAEFVHGAGPGDINWTIAAYESPVGDRLWHATATSTTPVEMVRTLLDTLASESAWGAGLGTHVSERTISETTRPLADEGWKQTVDGRWIHWTPRNGDAAGVQFDAFAAQAPGSPLPTWTVWGGNTADRPTWALRFSPQTPAAVLQDLTFEMVHGQSRAAVSQARRPSHLTASTRNLPPAPAAPAPRTRR